MAFVQPASVGAGSLPVNKPRLLSSSLVGAADQALLSAFNLCVGVVFIRFAAKTDYADYALATTVLLLAQSLQNALVSSPLATLVPAQESQGAACLRWVGRRAQLGLSAGVAILAMAAALVGWASGHAHVALLALASGLGAQGVLAREFSRSMCFLRQDPVAALRGDLVYVALAAAGLGLLLALGWFNASTALATIGAAGVIAGWSRGAGHAPAHTAEQRHRAWTALWECARWALPSVVSSWLYANAYLFLVERLMSKDAVADLSASRLLLVPISLLVVGWSSAFRPRASRWLADGDSARVHRLAVRSGWAFVALGLAYGLVLWAALPLLQQHLLGSRYAGAGPLAAVWLLFFTVAAVRTVGMSSMLASTAAFRPLFVYGLVALGLSLPLCTVAAWQGQAVAVVGALVGAEVLLLILIWGRGWPAIRLASRRSA